MHRIFGEISLPGDKSISHRLLMLSLIYSRCRYEIANISSSFDVKSTINAVKMYGINVEDKEGLLYVSRDNIKEPDDIINIGNSGTTIRLFTGIASGLEGFYSVFTGDKSIRNRPMERVISPLKMMGANILSRKHNKNAPISVYGSKLLDFEYSSSVASAQVKSALIFASTTLST
jgi:3-phosphoshikimate 1-carboxyvinyltransferase